jgi:hypothetical protein
MKGHRSMGPRWTDLDNPLRFESRASILDSTAGKKEAGAMATVGGAVGLHGSGVTRDRPDLGSGGQGITAGWLEVRGRIGELI